MTGGCGSRSARLFLLFASIGHLILTTGLILGWSGVVLILNGEGTVAHLCDAGDAADGDASVAASPVTCPRSDVFIATIFTVGQVGATAGPIALGTLIDRIGPRYGALLCASLVVVGLMLVATGLDSKGEDAEMLLPVGFALVGAFGSGVQFTAFHIANVFEEYHGTVTSCMSAAFGVSSLIFPLMQTVWSSSGWSGATVFWAVAIMDIAWVLYATQLPMESFELGDTVEYKLGRGFYRVRSGEASSIEDKADGEGSSEGGGDTVNGSTATTDLDMKVVVADVEDGAAATAAAVAASGVAIGSRVRTPYGDGTKRERRADGVFVVALSYGTAYLQPAAVAPVLSNGVANGGAQTKPGLKKSKSLVRALSQRPERTLKQQLLSTDFLFVTAFLVFSFWRLNFYLASANVRLKLLGGEAEGNDFTEIFSWVAPFGALSAPLSGRLLDRVGLFAVALLTTLLSTIHGVVVLVPSLPLQIAAFVTYTLGLETLFAWFFTAIGRQFGYKYFGTLSGIAFVAMGLAIVPGPSVVDGLLAATDVTPQEAFRITDMVLLCLSPFMLAYCCYLRSWELRMRDQPAGTGDAGGKSEAAVALEALSVQVA
uniref:Major facilitator superfamily (MFS) profile domain-containing protein n=1 Tax=Bicosoecida sp. CB-2014 TaxID=1486930 RepID=A0A7S1G570_9STRA|mmetsp:Transcript_14536/g.50632  ORF Transcript_14536/g.50632 Transcript_14536/m.50632 type:complete len:599 (+) Transcript_14536:211-2007(+)